METVVDFVLCSRKVQHKAKHNKKSKTVNVKTKGKRK